MAIDLRVILLLTKFVSITLSKNKKNETRVQIKLLKELHIK